MSVLQIYGWNWSTRKMVVHLCYVIFSNTWCTKQLCLFYTLSILLEYFQYLEFVNVDFYVLLKILCIVVVMNLKDVRIFVAMKRLQEMGSSYFILDLRDNLGGLVQVCVWCRQIYHFALSTLMLCYLRFTRLCSLRFNKKKISL